jgi:hypothetical protein
MKSRRFDQLNELDREDALIGTTMYIIHEVITGMLTIEFSLPANQKAYREIMKEAGAQDSVRYAQYAMMHHEGIKSEIEKIALIVCTEALYDEDGRAIIDEPIKESAV